MKTRKLSEIKIKEEFKRTIPNVEKMQECRENWNKYKKQDRYIVVNHEGYLIDGYIQYLILKENNIEESEIKIGHYKRKRWARKEIFDYDVQNYRNEPTTYVYGYHPNCKEPREFMWRIPKSYTWMINNVQIGDVLLCGTKFGAAPVVVTKVETLDKCPSELVVKKVVGKSIMRNGAVVKW